MKGVDIQKQSIWKEEVEYNGPVVPSKDDLLDGQGILEISKMDQFVQQNSPINNEIVRNSILNNLLTTEIDGQIKLIPVETRHKTKKQKQVYTLCSLSYTEDTDINQIDIKGRYRLTAYDRRVYNALGTIWINGKTTTSLTEVYRIMMGNRKKNPNRAQLEAVSQAIEKLNGVKIYLDLTEEINANIVKDKQPLIDAGFLKSTSDKVKSAVVSDRMINKRELNVETEQGGGMNSIQILNEPVLLTYNRAKGTLLTIPMEYVGLDSISATEKSIAIQDYLLMRIWNYKKGVMLENKILYETMYRDSGQEKPKLSKDRIRDREMVKKMMEEWQRKGLIENFEEIQSGRSWVGVCFYLTPDREPKKVEKKD